MKTRNTLIAVAVAALIPMGAALAGDYGNKDQDKSMAGSNFKKLDANKDGRISQAEAAVDSTIVFSSADANGDGYLDKDELKAASSTDHSRPQSGPSTSSPDSSMPPQGTDPTTDPSGTRSPDTETPQQ